MTIELWDSRDLYLLQQDMRLDPVPDFFWRNFFGTDYYSEDTTIKFAELPVPYRKMAPFVMPTSQGKPIFERRGETVKQFAPAYIKVKDAVRVVESRNVLPSEIWREGGGGLPSLQARFDKRVAEVSAFHRRAIDMRKCAMAAQAFINAQVTVAYAADQGEEHPEVTIDYGRAAGIDETLTGTFIDDPDFDLIGMLTDISNTMYNATYGGRPVQWIVGSEVAPFVVKNKGLLELLDTNIRGGEGTSFQRGLFNIDRPGPALIGRVGGIGQGLEIWTYKDVLENPNGDMIDILNPKAGLLIAPGAGGVMAHGAIYDVDAFEGGNISTDVFPKMFKTNDPGDMYVMHQSSPLPVNIYPNRVSKQILLD